MPRRPTSITVVAWILISVGSVAAISSTASLFLPQTREILSQQPTPLPVLLTIMYLGLAIMVLAGVAILRGRAWARNLYVGWTLLSLIYSFVTTPAKVTLVPSVLFFAIVCVFLFRPAANAFFANPLPSDGQPHP